MQPAGRSRSLQESVGGHGGRPVQQRVIGGHRVGQASGDESAGRGQFQDQAEALLVDPGQFGQPLELAHTQTAAAQLGDRRCRQRLQHNLDLADQLQGRTGGGGIGIFGGGGRRDRIRLRQVPRTGLVAAKYLADVAGQQHCVGVDSMQQPGCQQALHRPVGRRPGSGVASAAQRRPGHQLFEHLAGGLVEVLDQLADLLGGAFGILGGDLTRKPGQRVSGLR